MKLHDVRPSLAQALPAREDQLAWKLAAVAAERVPAAKGAAGLIIDQLLANATSALSAINSRPAISARGAALAHAKKIGGAQLFGVPSRIGVSAEWAAWANGAAVRALATSAIPSLTDLIPPVLAVAQAREKSGRDFIRAVVAAAEIHAALNEGLDLAARQLSPIAHLAPAQAAGIGALLGLKQETIYQALQQAVHVACVPALGASPAPSSWPVFAPAHAGKLAIEAVDRAMRGEGAPTPAYESEIFARAASPAPDQVRLPEPGETRTAILATPTAGREAQIATFLALTEGLITPRERNRFVESVQNLHRLTAGELSSLNVAVPAGALDESKPGIF
ncbi:MmgE/PrpD family protein [Acidocella sp.]|uniref:MmgE/PrpD family protein n=1 Tax=Acidocella sp. TaxID=50710 RepID=UPI002623CD3A|nr:MmgE/PrpD family protein [Acidocella sp.]